MGWVRQAEFGGEFGGEFGPGCHLDAGQAQAVKVVSTLRSGPHVGLG
jgi:hypothetical protein